MPFPFGGGGGGATDDFLDEIAGGGGIDSLKLYQAAVGWHY